WGLAFLLVSCRALLGHAYALCGRSAEGIPLLEDALHVVETIGFGSLRALFLMYAGEAYMFADRLEEALALAERALALHRERGQPGYEAYTLRFFGEVAARRDLPAHAESCYRDAFDLDEALGMRPLVAHCHRGLGNLYGATGKREHAREH